MKESRRLADIAHGRLVELGETIAVAESLTGGLISALLTEAPGTSVTFRGGLVVYCTDLKHTIAGVRNDDLEKYGPVDGIIAQQLATGARERLGADYGIGVTGVAGPGTQSGHAVGEVFIAIAAKSTVEAKRYELSGSRDDVRTATVMEALSYLVALLDGANKETT